MQKKTLASCLILLMVFNLVLPYVEPVFAAEDNGLILACLTDGKGILGKNENVTISLRNASFDSEDSWGGAYNLGVELILDDGLEVVGPAPNYKELLAGDDAGKQRVFWKDVKDLKLGEDFSFPIEVKVLETFRRLDEEIDPAMDEDEDSDPVAVEFEDVFQGKVNIYASDDARVYNAITPTVTGTFNLEVVPFEVKVSGGGKHVKGAGLSSADGNWEQYEYGIKISKGTGYALDLDLANEVDGSLEAGDFRPAPASETVADNKRRQSWSLSMAAETENESISFDAAIFNRAMENNDENTGAIISDGSELQNKLTYTGRVSGGEYSGNINYSATAKDIVIIKSSSGSVEYGGEIEHTLTVQTNEYYDVTAVRVVDTVEDGQTFAAYTQTPAQVRSKTESPAKNAAGETILTWDLGDMPKETVITLKYTTTVDANWTSRYGGGPLYAGDTVSNNAAVYGTVYYQVGAEVNDSAGTGKKAAEPSIAEEIIKVNGTAAADSAEADLTVGDTATFAVKYNAAGLEVKQHQVEIVDFLPEGTVLVSSLAAIALNGVEPRYYSGGHYLLWELGDLPEDIGTMTAEVQVRVADDPVVVSDKGEQNLVKLSYQNSPGNVTSKSAAVSLSYIEPDLTITKTASPAVDAAGGTEVTFTLEVENTGGSPAYEVVVEDLLPGELTSPVMDSLNSPPGMDLTVEEDKVTFTAVPGIEAGETATITYTATVVNPVGAGRQFTNTASLKEYYGNSGEPRRTYNQDLPGDSANLEAPAVTLTKAVYAPADISGLRIGDEVIYRITLNVPAGTRAFNGYIEEYIPANQTFAAAYYADPEGTALADIGDLSGNAKKIPTGDLSAGGHDYYIKTRIDNISSGNSETQSNDAAFFWDDKDTEGTQHNTSDEPVEITVKKPQLKISLTPDEDTIVQGGTVDFTVSIENIGLNTAYNFTPSVAIPDSGFSIAGISGGGEFAGDTITFPQVVSFAEEDVLTYTFQATLDELRSSGSQYQFIARTGNYYTTEDSAGEQASVLDSSNIKIQRVTIAQEIIDHSNTGEDYLRPGDTVTYQITTTVARGTVAYDVVITDTLPADFEPVSGAQTVFDIGDQDAGTGTEDIVITRTVQARAKTTVSYIASKLETNQVKVTWNKINGDEDSNITVNAVDVSINVKRPSLAIGTIAASGTEFNNATQEITITVPVTNTGLSPAYGGSFRAEVDPEFIVTEVIQPAATTSDATTIHWDDLDILPGADDNQEFQFKVKLKADGTSSAGAGNLPVNFRINSYKSRDSEDHVKIYGSVAGEPKYLKIAPATISKEIVSATLFAPWDSDSYTRPGDTVNYKVTVEVPANTTLYAASITDTLGPEQEAVALDGAEASGRELTLAAAENLAEGSHTYEIAAVIDNERAYTPDYQFANTAALSWADGSAGAAVQGPVEEPELGLSMRAATTDDPPGALTKLDQEHSAATVTITISNAGATTAYNPVIETGALPAGIDITDISNGGVKDEGKIIWNLSEDIAGGDSLALSFNITEQTVTPANTDLNFSAGINQYSSKDDSTGKTYSTAEASLTIPVEGKHTLTGASPDFVQLIVEETGEFLHTLTNNGAGQDSYAITMENRYPAKFFVKAGDTWQEQTLPYNTGAMNKGDAKEFKLEVTPEISRPKGDSDVLKLTAVSTGNGSQKAEVADTVEIIGAAYNSVYFDGITEPQDDDDWQAEWRESTIGAGSTIKLAALTSYDIDSVEAKIKGEDSGYIAGTNVTPISLTKLAEGKWEGDFTLPGSISNGTYFVEFTSFNTGSEQDRETRDEIQIANNTFVIAEPELAVGLTPGEKTVAAAEEIEYTLSIDNHAGETGAYQFVPYVELPLGLKLNNVDGSYSFIDRIIRFFSGPTVSEEVYDGEPFDLSVADSVYRKFTVETLDLSADEELNISAGSGNYYTAGDKDAARRKDSVGTAALLKTATVSFVKSLDATTNSGEVYVRPGDQLVYLLKVDIPDGLIAANVQIREEVNANLIINEIKVGSYTETVNDTTWTKEYTALDTDKDIYVYAQVVKDVEAPLQALSTATVSWTSKYRDYQDSITHEMTREVKEPYLSLTGFSADKDALTEPEEEIEFTAELRNDGGSPAYQATVIAVLPESLQAVSGGLDNGDYDPETNSITWIVENVAAAGSAEIKFRAQARADAALAINDPVDLELVQYYSTELSQHRVHYLVNDRAQVNLTRQGDSTLEGGAVQEIKAGNTLVFEHRLNNLGAGQDTFTVTIDSPFAVVLKADGQIVEDGRITVNAGGCKDLELTVEVPEETAKTGDNLKYIYLTVDSDYLGSPLAAQDRIKVIGEELDGWVDNGLWSAWDYAAYRENWQEAAYYPGSAVKLAALTSVDVTGVYAHLTGVDGTTYGNSLELNAVNEATDVEDGFTKWENTSFILPDGLPEGRYFVEFTTVAEEDRTPTELRTEKGFNNYFTLKGKINLVGTVSDRETGEVIPDAAVKLLDLQGVPVAETATDSSGNYRFNNVAVKKYRLQVTHDLYQDFRQMISTLPAQPSADEVRFDVRLLDFVIELEASPSTIVGNGTDTAILIATVRDKDGNPIPGVDAKFNAPLGSFPDGRDAVTDADGQARVTYRSVAIEGIVSQEIPVRVEVFDPVRDLYAEDQILITFAPGAIAGVVLDNETGEEIEGARVVIYNEELNFRATYLTGTRPDLTKGEYKMAIPRGNVIYHIEITKPVLVNNMLVYMTFKQKARAGMVTGTGQEPAYPSENTLTGVILQNDTQGIPQLLDQGTLRKLRVRQIQQTGEGAVIIPGGIEGSIDEETGIFSVEDLQTNQSMRFAITRIIPDTGEEIIIGTINVEINDNGEIKIGTTLIDPYGTITDAQTGTVLENVAVELYYADTPENIAAGKTPGQLVPLPVLENPPFPPNDNKNPQYSDRYGKYAWLVFPHTDYYIVAKKPGYGTYTSEIISVGEEIVRHDFQMRREADHDNDHGGGGGTVIPGISKAANQAEDKDIAVSLEAGQKKYEEGSIITFTINYKNKVSLAANDVVVKAAIPRYTEIAAAGGAELSGNFLIWHLGQLADKAAGSLTFKVKVLEIPQGEVTVKSTVQITSTDSLINYEDDISVMEVLLFSNRFGKGFHKLYIVGYPDGNFKPDRYVSRAEIAVIFSRILDLRGYVQNESLYTDVPEDHWAVQGIEAAARKGLFGGYADGSFRPDQPITRAELSSVIARYLQLSEPQPVKIHFSDIKGHWALNVMEEIYRNGIIKGYADGTFRPDGNLIRSEAVTMINRLLYRGPLQNVEPTFPDVPKDHWAFGEVEESTRSHEFMRNEDGSEILEKLVVDQINM
ncbi:MAG: S-layer homology domain-containing protein [Peptococcaceae bacterium]